MKTKKYILVGICFFLLVSLLFAMYRGRKVSYYIMLEGTILSVDDSSLKIQGDPQNDDGLRDQYIIKKDDSISITPSSGDNIGFSSLAVGDHVEIHYIDHVAKSKVRQYALNDGAVIPNVQQINVIE